MSPGLLALARENVVPAWRRAVPYAGLGGAVLLAGAFLVHARRRSRGP